MAEDNWANKDKGMICASCRFFVLKGNGNLNIGRCRRRSPTLDGWPVMFSTDWCGDHKLDEDKIKIEPTNA